MLGHLPSVLGGRDIRLLLVVELGVVVVAVGAASQASNPAHPLLTPRRRQGSGADGGARFAL